LDKLEREHLELHSEAELIPPLSAEQHELDLISAQRLNAQKFYEVAKDCPGNNHPMLMTKLDSLDSVVLQRAEAIEVQVKRLRRRQEAVAPGDFHKLDVTETAGTCPVEVLEMNSEDPPH